VAQAFAQPVVPVYRQGEGCDGGAEHAGGEAMHHLRRQDGLPCGPECQNKSARADRDDCQQSRQPPVVEPIDKGARWQLACKCCEGPDAERETNVSLGPSVLGKNDGNERTEPGLHGGDKEVNRAQILPAARRSHVASRPIDSWRLSSVRAPRVYNAQQWANYINDASNP
jgi:hypothetical protein